MLRFLAEIEKYFAKSDKAETCIVLQSLISMKYQSKGNVRENIMGKSNIASKLKALNVKYLSHNSFVLILHGNQALKKITCLCLIAFCKTLFNLSKEIFDIC